MRIDPNRTPDPNALPPSAKASARAAGTGPEAAAAPSPAGGDSIDLSVDQVRQALQTNTADNVARARALIASGQLDTPEAVQRAAQALAKFGI
ncbi:MAG: hypothetical protein NTV86_21585 [Planctomycetota bacterium]|nr:hypothetical protein [Planctomycetota bacterium]